MVLACMRSSGQRSNRSVLSARCGAVSARIPLMLMIKSSPDLPVPPIISPRITGAAREYIPRDHLKRNGADIRAHIKPQVSAAYGSSPNM